MECPLCKGHQHVGTQLQSDGFMEGITECSTCGAVWSVNHGVTEIVKDPQRGSFLEVQTECVENDDYSMNLSDRNKQP